MYVSLLGGVCGGVCNHVLYTTLGLISITSLCAYRTSFNNPTNTAVTTFTVNNTEVIEADSMSHITYNLETPSDRAFHDIDQKRIHEGTIAARIPAKDTETFYAGGGSHFILNFTVDGDTNTFQSILRFDPEHLPTYNANRVQSLQELVGILQTIASNHSRVRIYGITRLETLPAVDQDSTMQVPLHAGTDSPVGALLVHRLELL
uniref:Hemagglutinin-esterase n=1 Tax=Lygus hesperus TaxID=30085 RepID=A0A0A9WZS8_LYGHE